MKSAVGMTADFFFYGFACIFRIYCLILQTTYNELTVK